MNVSKPTTLVLTLLMTAATGFAKKHPKNPVVVGYGQFQDATWVGVRSLDVFDTASYQCPGHQTACEPTVIVLVQTEDCNYSPSRPFCDATVIDHDLQLLFSGQRLHLSGDYKWRSGLWGEDYRDISYAIPLKVFRAIASSNDVEGKIGDTAPWKLDKKTLVKLQALAAQIGNPQNSVKNEETGKARVITALTPTTT